MKYIVKIGGDSYEVHAYSDYDAKIMAVRSHMKKYPTQFYSQLEVMTKMNVNVLPTK